MGSAHLELFLEFEPVPRWTPSSAAVVVPTAAVGGGTNAYVWAIEDGAAVRSAIRGPSAGSR